LRVPSKGVACAPTGAPLERQTLLEDYIHRENLALFQEKLAETKDEAARLTLLRLIAEEEAKPPPSPKMG